MSKHASAAERKETLDQHEDGDVESVDDAPTDGGGERRETPDSHARDRRTIARVNDSELRSSLQLSLMLCRYFIFFGCFYGGAQLLLRATQGTLELNRTLFFDLVLLMIISAAFQVARSIRSWLATESVPKLARVAEAFRNLLIVLAVVATTLGIAHLVMLWH